MELKKTIKKVFKKIFKNFTPIHWAIFGCCCLITTGAGFYYAGINMFVEDVKDLIDATGAESDVSEDTMEILVKVLNSLPAVALFAASFLLFLSQQRCFKVCMGFLLMGFVPSLFGIGFALIAITFFLSIVITTFYEKSDGICETFQSDPNIDDPELVDTLCDDLRRDFRLIMVGSSMIVVSCIVGTILSCVFYCTVVKKKKKKDNKGESGTEMRGMDDD